MGEKEGAKHSRWANAANPAKQSTVHATRRSTAVGIKDVAGLLRGAQEA